jgi:hypothetical protein
MFTAMKLTIAVQASTALITLALVPICPATVINFDNLSGSVALTNQYAAQGVLFDQIEATNLFPTSVVAVSAPNYATPFFSNANPGMISFVDPANSNIQAYATIVTLTLNGYNNVGGWFDGATINALDLSGTAIAGQTQTINPSNGTNYGSMTITFTGQVHALEFDNILNNGRLGILPFDNVGFGELIDARSPEPSTFLLVGAVLVAASMARRRRRS